jgi:hypothetical protein
MKIIKLTAEWENGQKYSIEEPDITQFFEAGGNKDISMYLLLAFALNLSGGLNWQEVNSE